MCRYLPTAYKLVNIVIQTLLDNPYGFFAVALFVDGGGFIFKRFVYGEEVFHFFNHVGGQLRDILITVVVGVIKRNCNDFFVLFAAVKHGDNADGVSPYKCKRCNRLGAEQEHVKGVAVIAVCTRNKSIVGRIVRRSIEDTV